MDNDEREDLDEQAPATREELCERMADLGKLAVVRSLTAKRQGRHAAARRFDCEVQGFAELAAMLGDFEPLAESGRVDIQ